MSNVKIKKAKIKDALFLEVEYSEELPGHSRKDTTLKCTIPIHEDLKSSFDKLHKHLAILCDDFSAKPKTIDDWDFDNKANYSVRGFSIGGNDENEGVTISGSKEAKHGLVNLNSPFQKWEGSEYKYIDDLSENIEACIYEVEQYLFNGKRAPEKQTSIDFPEGNEEETENAELTEQ
jgi:hypothetical protein